MRTRSVDRSETTKAVSEAEIRTLNERFSAVNGMLGEAERRLPLVLEFLGPPKAFKTTVRDIVGRLAEKAGMRVYRPIEGASLPSQRVLRENLVAFNAWTACYALQQLLESRIPANRHDLVLLDRGLIDAVCWFRCLERLGYASEGAEQATTMFFGLGEWLNMVDGFVLLTCDQPTSSQRETMGHLARSNKLATSDKVLSTLHQTYEELWTSDTLTPFTPSLKIDTSGAEADPKRVSVIVAEQVLDLLESAIDPQYVVVPASSIDFKGFVPSTHPFTSKWYSSATTMKKHIAELDSSHKQIVAYAFIEVDGKYLRLKRTGDSNRPELVGQSSLGVGGHVESSDVHNGESGGEVLRNALLRELNEELVFDGQPEIQFKGWINDESIEAGKYHVAAIHRARFRGGRVTVRPEVSDQEFGTKDWKLVGTEPIFKHARRFDPWSQYIIQDLLGGPQWTGGEQQLMTFPPPR